MSLLVRAIWTSVVLGACLALVPLKASAGFVTLTQNDVSLSLYASASGVSWHPLTAGTLAAYFGPHRCACPSSLLVQLQLTSTGQSNLGSSTVTVNFLLGANCFSSPSSCISLGQVGFSASQTAASPTFNTNLVYQTATGGTGTCSRLTASATTLWAILAQDGTALSFSPTIILPVIAGSVGAPQAVSAQPANQGLLVSWAPPSDTSLVAGYQVLCLPKLATPPAPGYETCGLAPSGDATAPSPADTTQVCSDVLDASTTSIRVGGLVNGTPYAIAVIAIDPAGSASPPSATVHATPQPTGGFFDKYEQDGGAATGCAVLSASRSAGTVALGALTLGGFLLLRRRRRRVCKRRSHLLVLLLLIVCAPVTAGAQDFDVEKSNDDWASNGSTSGMSSPPDWGIELGLSMYRPAVDSEFGSGPRPFADTFSNNRQIMTEAELVRYVLHRNGALGVGLRVGYYKITAASFLADGVTRGGDETGLRLIPFSPSLIYRATTLPGLSRVPLIPYGKLGLDATYWTASNTGSSSRSGLSVGWHAAAGIMLGLSWLESREVNPEAIASPCALFFEWDYAAINGLGFSKALHVGDSTWFAGIMFDL